MSCTALAFGDFGNDQNQSQKQGQLQGQAQGQLQGQAQGQAQGQGQFSINKNGNYNSNRNSNHNRNSATGVGVGVARSYSDGSSANNSMTNNYEAVDLRDNTPDAYAPPLATSNGTCMGSSSIGGSGPGLGLSVGSTWRDDACSRRYNAQMMHALGHADVAVNIMCQDESVAQAAPHLCPQPEQASSSETSNGFFATR